MFSSKEAEEILGRLCVDLGFCLLGEDYERLIRDPPTSAESFVNEVIIAEGLEPDWIDRALYRRMESIAVEIHNKYSENDVEDYQ